MTLEITWNVHEINLHLRFNWDLILISLFSPGLMAETLDKKSKNIEHLAWEEFEDTKGVIRILKSKKNRQHNSQKEKDKRTNNDLQNIHIKLKIE